MVISTLDEHALGSSVPSADDSEYPFRLCNHQEFDSKVMPYATNAVSHGYSHCH